MLPLIGLLAFAAVSLAAYAVLMPSGEDPVGRRIRGYTAQPGSQRRLNDSFGSRVIAPGARRLGAALARVLPNRLLNSLERMLIMANSRMPLTIFLSIWAGCIALGTWIS